MKVKIFLCYFVCAFSMLSSVSCSKTMEDDNNDNVTLSFRVSNYMQYSFDDLTRSVSKADTLAHLAFAVFDATTDALVGTVSIQDRGDSGYGTFNVTVPKGQYRILFLGYDGSKTCHIDSPTRIYFDNSYVPHTFLYSKEITVDGTQQSAQQIVLQRVVSAFRINVLDELPSNLACFRLTCQNGGTILNGKTGYVDTANAVGRTGTIDIPASYLGTTGAICLTYYLFLPINEVTLDCVVDALDAKGNVIKSRTFTSVPMQVNVLTNYSGNFFDDSASTNETASFDIGVNMEWANTVERSF